MAQHSIVNLAKQGDPRAIAYLMTCSLKKYGIRAKASRQGHCLKLLLEAEQVPPQSTMTQMIVSGLEKLNVAKIQTLKLYGRKSGQPQHAWRQMIVLSSALSTPIESGHPLEPNPDLDPNDGLDPDNGLDPNSELEPDRTVTANQGLNLDSGLEPDSAFQLDDLDPEALIFLPIEPSLQLQDLDPDALILFPLDLAADGVAPSAAPEPAEWNGTAAPDPISHDPTAAPLSIKLPTLLTRLLYLCLGLQLAVNTLQLGYSLLNAGSFSLYTGLDLDNTNQTFAGLLSVVVGIASFVFAPLDSLRLWVTLITGSLFLLWLHRLHRPLRQLFGSYPISPKGAVLRFVLPLYHFWGIGNVFFTLAKRLAQAKLQSLSRSIRRLTLWLYLLVFSLVGLQGLAIWLIVAVPNLVLVPWFTVARDAILWLLSLVWLRLVRSVWRGVRTVYRDRMAPFLPVPSPRPARSVINLRAILLGGGTSLLSLIMLNCLLALVATIVFVSNDVPSESIIPTFYDSEGLLILVLIGSFFCIGLGGFLTASLAPVASWLHALGLGVFLTLIGILVQRSTLLLATTELPFWFQTASTVLIIPAAVLGGGLYRWLKTL